MTVDMLALRMRQDLGVLVRVVDRLGLPDGTGDAVAASGYRKVRSGADPTLDRLEAHWYETVRVGDPDYRVYGTVDYLAEAWLCWWTYSRNYLRAIRRRANNRIADDCADARTVVDVGCGIGFSTAALTSIFPRARVVGTNVAGLQYDVAEQLAGEYGFEVVDDATKIGPADVVFASEYFEHFPAPVDHLDDLLCFLAPDVILAASTFGPSSIGHFDEYQIDGRTVPGNRTGRLFNQALRDRGYAKIDTGMWNGRPAYWRHQR